MSLKCHDCLVYSRLRPWHTDCTLSQGKSEAAEAQMVTSAASITPNPLWTKRRDGDEE